MSANAEYKQATHTPGQEHAFRALGLLQEGVFTFRTLEEAHQLSSALASLCPYPVEAAIGLGELMLNAIEHGNLGIHADEKNNLKQQDRWADEVARRLQLPEFKHRQARVTMRRMEAVYSFLIEDQGDGFNWHEYLDIDASRAEMLNGRGIALARQISFSSLEYRGCGNQVFAIVKSHRD